MNEYDTEPHFGGNISEWDQEHSAALELLKKATSFHLTAIDDETQKVISITATNLPTIDTVAFLYGAMNFAEENLRAALEQAPHIHVDDEDGEVA